MKIDSDFFDFVRHHRNDDPLKLRMKLRGVSTGFDLDLALLQIEMRRKHASKLGSLFANERFLVPDSIAAEQATHPLVAAFHASLVEEGSSAIDMTCGLGIDDFAFATKCSTIRTFDIDDRRASTATFNTTALNLGNVTITCGDSVEAITNENLTADIIFVDPARRSSSDRRVYALKDCRPDVEMLLPVLTRHAPKIFIKASPMLDISDTLQRLPSTKNIYSVSLKGECKEVLVEIENGFCGSPSIHAAMIDADGTTYLFRGNSLGSGSSATIADKEDVNSAQYIYEPDAAVMKIAPWQEIAARFAGIKKLHEQTHIFIAKELYEEFPGRKLRVKSVFKYRSAQAHNLSGQKINVVCRNAGHTPDELRKRLHIKDGGNDFLYSVKTAAADNIIFLAEKD